VSAVLKIQTQRPSALTAVCTLVPELPKIVAAPTHVRMGYGAAAATGGLGAALTRSQWLRQETVLVPVKGINGFAAKPSATRLDPVGGVRGIPPRGWPV
jgi:hypothetical protein